MKRKIRIIAACVCVGLILIYALPMFYLGEGSIMDAFFPYFIALILICAFFPYGFDSGERRARIIASSLAAAAVIIPAIIFICMGKETIEQLAKPNNFWRIYPYIIFAADALTALIISAAYKRIKKKNMNQQ